MVAEDRLGIECIADRLDEARLEDVERPAREGAQQLVSGGRGDRAVEACVRQPERLRSGGSLPSCSAIAASSLRRVSDGRVRAARPASGTSRWMRASTSSPSETLCVSSIIEIESLRLRLMPSFGVLATKMPPPGPRDARIRCELARAAAPPAASAG